MKFYSSTIAAVLTGSVIPYLTSFLMILVSAFISSLLFTW